MQAIDILNLKKYFKRKGDNALAKVGHVNHLMPLVLEDSPITLGIKPAFVGQVAIIPGSAFFIAISETNWILIWD